MATPPRVLLDLDTGIDDALALLYLADAWRHGRVDLVGCGTVAGNVEVERTTRNTLKLLELLDLEVPVAAGAGRPMRGPLHTAPYVHGGDGLADTRLGPPRRRPTGEHAVDQILRLSRVHAGELTVLAFGPLTNRPLHDGLLPASGPAGAMRAPRSADRRRLSRS